MVRESPLSKLPPKQGTSNASGFHPRTIFPEPDPGRRQVPDRSLRGEKGLWNRKNKFRNLSSTRSMSQSSKRLLAERVHESEVIAAVGLRYVSREYWTTDPVTETRHNPPQRNILSTTIGPDYIELQSPPTACLHIKCTSKRLQECQQT